MWKNGLRQKNVAIKRNSQRKKKKTVGERWRQTEFMYFIMPSVRLWSMSHYHFNTGSLLRLFSLSSLTPFLPPSTSPSSSILLPPPSWISLHLLCWHNPSFLRCNLEERAQAAAGEGEKLAPVCFPARGVKFELGWEWNPHSFAETMRACVCLCVPAAFNVMLIQFIFNEETVSSYREAKEISGLLHSGKSIAHLFILLFELFVCLKNKPSGYAAKISVASKSFNSFVHTVCVCVCVRASLQRKITTSLTAM